MNNPKVRDYMSTELTIIGPAMEINQAMQILLDKHISGAPVVDDSGALVGVLSKKDCLKAALNASYYQSWGGAVSAYMSSAVESLDPDLDIVEAAQYFLSSHYRRFPVIEDGHLVGQISRADVLRALAENWR